MTTLNHLISRIPNYFKAFGLFHGIRLLLQIERHSFQKTRKIYCHTTPGYPGHIRLRRTLSDHSIFWQCIVQRQYDFNRFAQSARLMQAYQATLKTGKNPLIIDCGGNIGLSTLYLAKLLPKSQIYVVEPDEHNFQILKMNTSALGNRVTAIQGGVWDENIGLKISNPNAGSAAFRVEAIQDGLGTAIQSYTIDDICTLAGVDAPFIVKIDIEGAQSQLFKSNTEWVKNTHLIMLELDDWAMPWKGTSRSFFSCISRYPFDYLISGETIFCFRDFTVA